MNAFRRFTATTAVAVVMVTGGALVAHADTPPTVYNTPGGQQSQGRLWNTSCEKYSSNVVRCRTDIWATQVVARAGHFVSGTGWVFNNLTYLPLMTRAQWKTNPLGHAGQWTATDGRKWRTECDTPVTGGNGCRSWIWTSFVSSSRTASGGWVYRNDQGWVMNNIVRFRS